MGEPKQNNIDDILRGLLGKIKRFLVYAGALVLLGLLVLVCPVLVRPVLGRPKQLFV